MINLYKYFFFFIFFLLLFNLNVNSKDIIEIDNNSLVILKDNDDISLLIKESDKFSLFVIDGKSNRYKYFTKDIDNVIYMDKVSDMVIDGVNIEIDDYISINMMDKSFCLYNDKVSNDVDYSDCNYIYIINNSRKVYFKLNDDMNAIFYNKYSKFSNKFLEEMFSSWVDTYTVNSKEFIVIDFNYDYEIKNYSINN